MSGKHRRPEPDPLPDVDVAHRIVAGPVVETSSTVVSGPTVVAKRSRSAQRRQRRQSSRRRTSLIAGAVVLVLLAVVGGWYLLAGRGSDDPRGRTASGEVQQTLLVQLAAADGSASATALLGIRADKTEAVGVLVPSRLIVDAVGSGSIPFGETLASPDKNAAAKALTDLLGVKIGGSWVLSPAGLAALVDAVGGVQAAVDVDVVAKDAKGQEVVVVRAGSQRLRGAAAEAYAAFAADGEPEQARLARFNEVLRGVLTGLPSSRDSIANVVSRLGKGSQSTLPAATLSNLLARAHSASAGDKLAPDVLPVNAIDTGAAEDAYGLNAGQAAAMMRRSFGPSLLSSGPGTPTRVLVYNGVGTPGLVDKARTRLVSAGFRFVNGGNAQKFDVKKTQLVVADATSVSQERGRKVAAALRVPAGSVEYSAQGQTTADVIVILGRDFRP